MSTQLDTRTEYLERLRDLLPYRDGGRILGEVDLLIQDRMDAEVAEGRAASEEAERRAVEALGPAEKLAQELMAPSVTVDLGTRRAFTRTLAIVFAAHLFLSIMLTAAGSAGPTIPGVLHALPTHSLAALVSSVVSVFLLDTGALFLLFALFGRGKAPARLPVPRLRQAATRRDAALALVLLALVALILHPLRDQIFAIRSGDRMVPILAAEVVALLPWLDLALGLFVLRQIVILVVGGEHALEVGVDALGSVLLAVVLGVLATRGELVRFPNDTLGKSVAGSLSELTTRVLLLVLVAAALFLTVRFVRRTLRLRQLLASR